MTSVPRLSAAGIERLRQQLDQRDWTVIHDVARFRLMSGRQLQLLHFGDGESNARAARRLLSRLTTHRILARLDRQIGGLRAGSSGYVYGLGIVGHRLLHPDLPGRRLNEVRDGFLQHTLAIANVYVGLRLAEQRGVLELLELETEPRCWRRLDDGTGAEWLKPDLRLVLGVGDEALHSFVELDQGSEHSPALLRKLRQYEAAYRSGTIETAAGVFPRVVWLVPTERRAARLRQLIHSRGLTRDLHAVALQPDAVAALSGDDELHRTEADNAGS